MTSFREVVLNPWDDNADAWTFLSRAGYDVYRDHLNTPAFLEMLPDISGLRGIDIGCGEGSNTRLLEQRGARMTAVDISERFVRHARDESIGVVVASGTSLPFASRSFHFATAFMSLMDFDDQAGGLREAHRVLEPGGFFQFSITHPCFTTPHRRNLRNEAGRTYAIEVGDYFRELNGQIDEWIFGEAPAELKEKFRKFRVPVHNRTMSYWINSIVSAGFSIEEVREPRPSDETVGEHPYLQDAQVVAYFLHVRCRSREGADCSATSG